MEAGARLGPYEIVEQLGAGGMGEVYLAKDARLGREVAIKVLPERFAADADRLARFEREARAAAALNHPSIAAVHDVGEANGVHFLVQEYLQGRTLREALAAGQVPLKRALDLAAEVAEGLAVAHASGVIHRDLKPDNVFVTPQGHAKILDFGLAKLTEPESLGSRDADGSGSPTVAHTIVGELLGTPGYLAPEQVRGVDVDHRADLFSFGCVLYEIVTGARAFVGESLVDTLHAIVHDTPTGVGDLRPELPLELGRILRKCLAKDPANRYQHADDLAVDLRMLAVQVKFGSELSFAAASSGSAEAVGGRTRPWVLGVSVGTILGVTIAWGTLTSEAPARVERSTLTFPQEIDAGADRKAIAISPDGEHLVFAATDETGRRLWKRHVGSFEADPIDGSERGGEPFFSPDGQRIGFGAGGALMRATLAGGAPLRITEVTGIGMGGTWLPDDTILYGPGDPASLMRAPARGGDATTFASPDASRGEISIRDPYWIPYTRLVLATGWRGSAPGSRIAAFDLETGERLGLDLPGHHPVWVPGGHIAYHNSGNIMVVPFDVRRREVAGPPVVAIAGAGGRGGGIAVTADATAYYIMAEATQRLVWVGRDGAEHRTLAGDGTYFSPAISVDGNRVAVSINAPGTNNRDVWILDLANGTSTRLTGGGNNTQPRWTPDGSTIVFAASQDGGATALYRKAAAAAVTSPAELLWRGDHPVYPSGVSPDGRWVTFYEIHPDEARNCWVLDLAGGGEPRPLVRSAFNERFPTIAPDGRWFAYVSDESGRDEIYVEPFPGPGPRVQVSDRGGVEPVWMPADRHLVYRELSTGHLVSARLSGEVGMRVDREEWFDANPYRTEGNYAAYAVAPAGSRFLMLKSSRVDRLGVIRRWDLELRTLAPVE